MGRSSMLRVASLLLMATGLGGLGGLHVLAGHPAQPVQLDPKSLTPEQNELLNNAYLALRMDLLPALKASGDQVVNPENTRSHYPLAALMRINPDKAQDVLLAIEGDSELRLSVIQKAARLVPAEAIPVLLKTKPKLKHPNTGESYDVLLAELETQVNRP